MVADISIFSQYGFIINRNITNQMLSCVFDSKAISSQLSLLKYNPLYFTVGKEWALRGFYSPSAHGRAF